MKKYVLIPFDKYQRLTESSEPINTIDLTAPNINEDTTGQNTDAAITNCEISSGLLTTPCTHDPKQVGEGTSKDNNDTDQTLVEDSKYPLLPPPGYPEDNTHKLKLFIKPNKGHNTKLTKRKQLPWIDLWKPY